MSSAAIAATPAGIAAPQEAGTNDVVTVAAKSDATQLKLLKKKKKPTAEDLQQIKDLEAKIKADRALASAKALEARKLAMREAAKAKAVAERQAFLDKKAQKDSRGRRRSSHEKKSSSPSRRCSRSNRSRPTS